MVNHHAEDSDGPCHIQPQKPRFCPVFFHCLAPLPAATALNHPMTKADPQNATRLVISALPRHHRGKINFGQKAIPWRK
jgi:hypothetical protein